MRSSGGGLMLAAVVAACCCCWLALCSELALGRFVVETNSLTITSPESVKGTYDSAIGNFGVPQYGGTLSGIIVYADDNSFACNAFSSSSRFKPKHGSPPTIVLVDRGGCYFAQKAWMAQKAGAAAVLVADDRDEPLITMDSPEDDAAAQAYLDNITIPSALIGRALGDLLRQTWKSSASSSSSATAIGAKLDWRESVPHPDDRVEYELWTSSNDECGPRCDSIRGFVADFRGAAQLLERGGFTLFSPRYITWFCPDAFVSTPQCISQCINRGRYCSPDPEQDFESGYDGKDVVLENLRQLCVHRVANLTLARPWLWWDYVTDFQIRCPMSQKRYNQECAESVIKSLGIDVQKVRSCMGDPTSDEENPILSAEQEAQIGHGTRSDVTMLPTIIINDVQYRGKLDKGAVLKAICAGFEEKTEPAVCLTPDMETNECLTNNGGCWQDKKANITACKDTFRGRVCACPLVDGVQFQGDGYTSCVASGQGRCKINNGGCWQETKEGKTFSACSDSNSGCECPAGFRGNGTSKCEDINECKEKTVCQCPECSCTNNWGSFDCQCQGGLLYMREHDACIGKKSGTSTAGWIIAVIVLVTLGAVIAALYVIYKYRLRSYMDSEIRAIMAQYMPLDSQNEVHSQLEDES